MSDVMTADDLITADQVIKADDYEISAGERCLPWLGGMYPVSEIRLTYNTEKVGYILIGEDDHVFGAAECRDGSLRVLDDCLPDSPENRHVMISGVIAVWGDSII